MGGDLGDLGIGVNTLVEGWTMTALQKQRCVDPEALAMHIDRHCLHVPSEAVYVAGMVLVLASDDSAACSAQNFMVEGGSI